MATGPFHGAMLMQSRRYHFSIARSPDTWGSMGRHFQRTDRGVAGMRGALLMNRVLIIVLLLR